MNITAIITLVTIVTSFIAWNKAEMYDKWMMIPYRVKHKKEFYRFFTSGFIHSGYIHLGFNILAFYSFGQYVEDYFGPIKYLLLYLIALVVSDIPTFLKQQNNPGYRSLGASGAVSAVIFSSIILNPLSQIGLMIFPIRVSGFIFGIIYLIYSYYQAKNSSDNIGHESHFFGALFGIAYTLIIAPQVIPYFIEQISNWKMF